MGAAISYPVLAENKNSAYPCMTAHNYDSITAENAGKMYSILKGRNGRDFSK